MENAIVSETQSTVHRVQIGVECPLCHWKQLIDVPLEKLQMNHPLALEMRRHLEAWMASRCPDHLNAVSMLSKN